MEARLNGYLKEMGSDDGETLYGFRAACAITPALSGAELSEITDQVRWTRRHTTLHNLQLASAHSYSHVWVEQRQCLETFFLCPSFTQRLFPEK